MDQNTGDIIGKSQSRRGGMPMPQRQGDGFFREFRTFRGLKTANGTLATKAIRNP